MSISVIACPSLSEVVGILNSEQGTRFFGGGTLVMRAINEGRNRFDRLVRTTDPQFTSIRASGNRMTIGAGVTMAQVIASRELDFLAPVARLVGGPAIRNMATVGGNLFARSPYGDFACALLALDAQLSVADVSGPTMMSLEQLLIECESGSDQRTPRLIEAVSVERPANGAFRFRKVSRVKPKGISVMSIAALLPAMGSTLQGVRVAYGAMAPLPIRVLPVERALEGQMLNEAGIAHAVAQSVAGINPPTDAIASSWYRSEVAPVHLKRLLLDR